MTELSEFAEDIFTAPPVKRSGEYPGPIAISSTVELVADPRVTGDCYGLDTLIFYSEIKTEIDAAKQICEGCDVKVKCLEYALEFNEKYGILGGTTGSERKKIRKARNNTV